MSKRKKILLTILTVILALTLVVSLVACNPKKKPDRKPVTPDPPEEEDVNLGGEYLTGTVSYIEKTLLKDLAAGLGVVDGKPQVRFAGEIALGFDIDKDAAVTQLQGFLGKDFAMEKDIKIDAVIGVDVVLDKENPINNIATIDISTSNSGPKNMKNVLSLCLKTESVDNNVVDVLYVGERLIHSGNMNWVKVDYPQVDYIDWVAEKLNLKGVEILDTFSKGNFISAIKLGPLTGKAILGLLPTFTDPKKLPLLEYDNSVDGVNKFSINFKYIGQFLEQMQLNLDTGGLFKDLDPQIAELLNSLICLVLGADADSELSGLDQLLGGKIDSKKQPEVSLVFYDDPDTENFNGLGLSYDGTNAENGVKFNIGVKNLVVQNLKEGNHGADAKTAAYNGFLKKGGLTDAALKATKPLSLQLEVGLENITEVDNTLLGLESAKVVVDVYPVAKLGWREGTNEEGETAKYFAANLDDTYAEARFVYKKIGDENEIVDKLVGVMDFSTEEDKKGLRLDLTPVFEALGAEKPDGKQNVFMKWNFDLSDEIQKAVENAMKANGFTPDGYIPGDLVPDLDPEDLDNAPSFAGDEVEASNFGKFINEIILSAQDSKHEFSFGDAFPGIQYLISNILLKAVNNEFSEIKVNADKANLESIELTVENVGALFASLLKDKEGAGLEGLIGASGIYWLDKDENVKLLFNFLTDWTLDEVEIAGKKLTEYIAKIVGGEISNNFWTEDTTSIDLLLSRENGLEFALTVGANSVVSEESKPLKAKVSVKLDIVGRDRPASKELEGFDDESAILFGSNNYNEALTETEHNQWRKVLNALLEEALPEGVVPFKMKTEVTLHANGGNYGENEEGEEIKSMKVVVNAGTIEEKDENDNFVFMLPTAPDEGKVFSKWTYKVGDEDVDFVFGVTEIPEGEFELTAVFGDA